MGDYVLSTYTEHALETGAKSQAASYVGIETPDGKTYWGAGVDSDIILSSVYALVSAVNRMLAARGEQPSAGAAQS